MATMDTLDPSALPGATGAVTYDPKSETVALPGGVVSVAGLTVVTGGAELSCGSCMLAFGVWGTLIGLSVVALGLWGQSVQASGSTSHFLKLGLVILAISLGTVGSVVLFRILMKRRRDLMGQERDEGRMVLVGESRKRVMKKMTV